MPKAYGPDFIGRRIAKLRALLETTGWTPPSTIRRGITEGRNVRLGDDPMVPVHPALRTDLLVRDLPLARLAVAERAADAAAHADADSVPPISRSASAPG